MSATRLLTRCLHQQHRMVCLGGLALSLSVCLVLMGCEKAASTSVSVSGEVKVEGYSMAEGLITFEPIAGTPGPKVSAPIEAGKYQITAEQGLRAGSFNVEVYGLPPGIKAMMNNQPVSHEKSNYREIAPQYNSQTKLGAVLQEGENVHSFEVEYQ